MGFLRVVFLLGWCCMPFLSTLRASGSAPLDSIFVNGKLIRVQASVEIDTVSRTRRWQFGWNMPGPVERRPVKQKMPSWNALELHGRFPVRSEGDLGLALDAFAHGIPAGGGGLSWSRVMPRPGARPWGFGVNGRLQSMRYWEFGELLPDSLIGFISTGDSQSILAVTRQAFELGVETDTLAMSISPTMAWSVGLSAVLRAELLDHAHTTLAFGLERWSAARSTIWVREPTLDEVPLSVVIEEGMVWQPVMSISMERSWGGTQQRGPRSFSGAWCAGLSAVWRPAESREWSCRLQLTRMLGMVR